MKKVLQYELTHKIIGEALHKLCTKCEEWFPCTEEYFHKNKKNGADGLYPYCKPCHRKKSIEWNHANYERYRANVDRHKDDEITKQKHRRNAQRRKKNGQHQEWLIKNKDKQIGYIQKALTKKHDISNEEWDDCRIYFNFRCAYCGKTWEQNKKETKKDLHKEHVVHDGAIDLSNCVPACRNCNSYKWQFPLDQWYNERNPVFSKERLEKIISWLNEDFKKYIRSKFQIK